SSLPVLFPLSLHDALPILPVGLSDSALRIAKLQLLGYHRVWLVTEVANEVGNRLMDRVLVQADPVMASEANIETRRRDGGRGVRSEEHTSELQSRSDLVCR